MFTVHCTLNYPVTQKFAKKHYRPMSYTGELVNSHTNTVNYKIENSTYHQTHMDTIQTDVCVGTQDGSIWSPSTHGPLDMDITVTRACRRISINSCTDTSFGK